MNRKTILRWSLAAVISVFIGMLTMWLVSGRFDYPLGIYIWNAGYSVCLGMLLFANGYIIEWFVEKYIDWIKRPVKSLLLAGFSHMVYTTLVIFLVNWFWFFVILNEQWGNFWQYNKITIISEYIIFIIVASVIYATTFFQSWKNEVSESEKIKREAVSLKYRVLQNQVNPHFLFNSLNILGLLIDVDTLKAKEFTRELSHFYRNLLHFKDQDIISLKEEIGFVEKYIYLQQIRFGDALEVEIIANEKIWGNVIPLSLQALVENAIKHNEISKANPLKIVVAVTDDYELIVENNIQARKILEQGSKTGLKNLAGRYEFLTGKKVIIDTSDNYFRVKLPLIVLNAE